MRKLFFCKKCLSLPFAAGEQAKFDEQTKAWAAVKDQIPLLEKLLTKQADDKAEFASFVNVEFYPVAFDHTEKLKELIVVQKNITHARAAEMQKSAHDVAMISIIALFIGLLVSVTISIKISGRMTANLSSIAGILRG